MNSHLAPEPFENGIEVLANGWLLAANFALFSNGSGTICFVQT